MTEQIAHTITTRVDGGTTGVLVEPCVLRNPHGFFKGAVCAVCPTITTSQFEANNFLVYSPDDKDNMTANPKIIGYSRDHDKGRTRTFHTKDTANTIHASNFETTRQYVLEGRLRIRKLTPRECFRLMDVSEGDIDKIYAAGISKTQQYKMAGNSIVVSCLYHLFRKMFIDTNPDGGNAVQLELF